MSAFLELSCQQANTCGELPRLNSVLSFVQPHDFLPIKTVNRVKEIT